MTVERYKWNSHFRRWQLAPDGVTEAEARRRGGPMPRQAPHVGEPVPDPIPAAFTRRAARELVRAIEARLAAAAAAVKAKAARRAARAAAARQRRLAYFRAYYVKTLKDRRRLKRAAAIT